MHRRALFVISLIAFVHAALYIVYLRPEWNTAWSDQAGYKRLGAVLAETGRFTRYPDYAVFVPEVIRTPGYPAFVATIYKVFGVGNDVAVTIAQAFVYVAICLLVYAIGRRLAGSRTAIVAATLTALFSPLPHFGALVLTELWTTFVVTSAMLIVLRAVQQQRRQDFALGGVLLSAATLVRPAFVLLPFFLALALPLLVRTQRRRGALIGWATLVVAASLTLLPWFTYNYVYLGRFVLSPAGGVGRGLWEGSWQGYWPGRVQAQLTAIAEDGRDIDTRARELGAATALDAGPMIQYVNEWRRIHDLWDTPQDPLERVRARIQADQEYLQVAIANITRDPVGHVWRRLTRGLFTLWAADIPLRYSVINDHPTVVIRLIWAVQVILLVVAASGAIWLWRRGQRAEAALMTLPLIYVTGVHLPLLCEARQSLPVKPLVLALAAAVIDRITSPGSAGS